MALAPRSGFGAGFGLEKLLSCQRRSIGFCNLVLANCIGVAASTLLCVAVAQVVLWSFAARWSFATRCLQKHWSGCVAVAQCCCCSRSSMVSCNFLLANRIGLIAPKFRRWVFDDFYPFWNRTFCDFLWLWRRDPVLEQVVGQRRAEMIWEWAEMRWQELRSAEKMWEELRRA